MSRILSSSPPYAIVFSKEHLSRTQSSTLSYCGSLSKKIQDLWKKICELFTSFFCCKKPMPVKKTASVIHETPKKIIFRNILPYQTPAILQKAPVPVLSSDLFQRIPSVLTVKILSSYLDVKDILSFERTSHANRKISNEPLVWKQQIDRNCSPVPCFVQSTKTCFTTLSRVRKTAWLGLDPNNISDFQPFVYYEGATTMFELKKMLSEKTKIPVEDIKIHHIGMGWKDSSLQTEGLKNFTMSSRYSHWGINENDDILCSEALKFYKITSIPSDRLSAKVNLIFSFRKT